MNTHTSPWSSDDTHTVFLETLTSLTDFTFNWLEVTFTPTLTSPYASPAVILAKFLALNLKIALRLEKCYLHLITILYMCLLRKTLHFRATYPFLCVFMYDTYLPFKVTREGKHVRIRHSATVTPEAKPIHTYKPTILGQFSGADQGGDDEAVSRAD